MKKFFVLYRAPVEEFTTMMQSMTPEERQASWKEWTDWMAAHKGELVDPGSGVGKTKAMTRGGVSDIRNDIGGYSVVQAGSHDEAMSIFKDSPHLKRMNGSIEVMEILEM